ncbi:hypothetical protein H0H92_008022 [Tricholoma furcatifolium]|nr:hypothetical protein H0H92_008022 [Tricholoma furcatifolium]
MSSSTSQPRSPPRDTHTPQPPPISYTDPQPTLSPVSPPATPARGRRPSLSNTMHWLSRNSSQAPAAPYSPAKPKRISEPKLIRSIELISQPRSGGLGSGATIVRTPDDALRETGVRLTYDGKADTGCPTPCPSPESRSSIASEKASRPTFSPSPTASIAGQLSPLSPPLPPLPISEDPDYLDAAKPPRPTRAPPSAPPVSLRSSLKARPVQQTDSMATVPPLPAHLSTSPLPPPFQPILVSEVPSGPLDPSKIIVTLETSTATHKTTLATLKSRPSHLSAYLSSLFPPNRDSVASSVYSHASEDMSAYRHHLTSQGLLQSSFGVHIFLDRSSTPYPHILGYLRSPLASPDVPECLPRGISMMSSSHRLESLLELRDEAAYLGLEGLHKMAVDEIRNRHGPRLHTRGASASTLAHSLCASVYSLQAPLERVEGDIQPGVRDSRSSESRSVKEDSIGRISPRSLPTPESWHEPGQREGGHSPAPNPPSAGWI